MYFRPRASDDILARAYCRNLKTRTGEPFGRIRLEAVKRFKPREWWVDFCFTGNAAASIVWENRYGAEQLSGRITRLSREHQVLQLAEKVVAKELTSGQFERMSAFLDAERLGVARAIYNDRKYGERRREARRLSLAVNEVGKEPIDLDLDDLLRVARDIWKPLEPAQLAA